MFKWIKGLFGGKVIEKGLDLIDKGKYTEQEKATKRFEWYQKMVTSLSSVTRRQLVWFVVAPYVLVACIFLLYAIHDIEKSKILINLLEKTRLGEAFWSIIGFYFIIEGVKKFKKQ